MSTLKANPSKEPRRRPLPLRRRILFVGFYLLFVVSLVWVGWKLVLHLGYGIPLLGQEDLEQVWDEFHPEIKDSGLLDADMRENDGYFDVLLLGASVLNQVAGRFERELRDHFGSDVRVYNTAANALTSRDSCLKFERLKDKPFDLIVVYHGINDVRMNCWPQAEFVDDYTHCRWYKRFQYRLSGKPIPVELGDFFQALNDLERPSPERLEYGSTIKTEQAFRGNIETIVSQARQRQQPVLLMSFAYYIPGNYSLEKFRRGQLDYGPKEIEFNCPAELWGKPENVAKTLDRHNQAIREIADRYENVLFVDQLDKVPGDGRHFSDPCHLTSRGSELFVRDAIAKILDSIRMENR